MTDPNCSDEQADPPSEAATPAESLVAALGSCLVDAIHALAEIRGIAVSELWVDLEADIRPIASAAEAEVKPQRLDAIKLTVHLEAAASRETLDQLVADATASSLIANTLRNPVRLEVKRD